MHSLLQGGLGLEKESLRITPEGHISQQPHPDGLGAPLTHPMITTDFSEALLEFITPVCNSAATALSWLEDLHAFTYQRLDPEEMLWITSMPCILGNNENIPLARYGGSNIARLKTLYRSGLSYRYGRAMQAIAGIHFNFSFSDDFWQEYLRLSNSTLDLQAFKTDQYFHLIRNFKRYSWLLIYLFGASPAINRCFVRDNAGHGLEEWDANTLYAPYGTSLRMGDLGYTSKAQSDLYICYNSLDSYAEGLSSAMHQAYAPYSQFGPEQDSDGKWQYKQLNDNVLQIENEFYSTIRPKRVVPSGKKPLQMLREGGVEYVEVRCMDLNPFLPVGIDQPEIHFLSCFLTFCLLRSSPKTNCDEFQRIDDNLQTVVREGRRPGLQLRQNGEDIGLKEWATEILQETRDIALMLDEAGKSSHYLASVDAQLAKVADPALTPSGKVLARMKQSQASFLRFGLDQSMACSDYFRSRELAPATLHYLEAATQQSIADREAIEAADEVDFDTYLHRHNAGLSNQIKPHREQTEQS